MITVRQHKAKVRSRVLINRSVLLITAMSALIPVGLADEWWDVDISMEAKLPPGVIPKFNASLLKPNCFRCEVTIDQNPYDSYCWIRVNSFGDSGTKPKSLSLEIRAPGFSPYVLETGNLKYGDLGTAYVENVHFTPVPLQFPQITNLAKIGGALGMESLQIRVANPTATTVALRRFAGHASHTFRVAPPDCNDDYNSYRIELVATGATTSGDSRDFARRALFSFPIQGHYYRGNCKTADSFDFDVPIAATVPARQTAVFQFEIRLERILDLSTHKAVDFESRSFAVWDWSVMLMLDNDTTITAQLLNQDSLLPAVQ